VGRAGEGGRGGEPDQADQERPASPEVISDAAAEQQQSGERRRVGGDDPLAVTVVEAQRVLRRGQGDVHDRGVQRNHQLRHRNHDQGEPATVAGALVAAHGCVGARHVSGHGSRSINRTNFLRLECNVDGSSATPIGEKSSVFVVRLSL